MREIPEQQIAAMAPNANAVNNARKIVKSGGFTEHARSEDDTFYMGSCKGSGSSAYRVTLDFADNDAPVCRCSCPSRQFPCKHGLALMMELSQGHHWDICDIPQDILDKRAKKDVRAGKKESQGDRPRAPSIGLSCHEPCRRTGMPQTPTGHSLDIPAALAFVVGPTAWTGCYDAKQ